MRSRSCASARRGSSAGRAGSARGGASAMPPTFCSPPTGAPHDARSPNPAASGRRPARHRHHREPKMADISRVALFGKLNSLAYRAIDAATVFCKLRGNPYVELVHWIHQVLQLQDSDLHRILKQFQVDGAVLAKELMATLDRLPRGATA